MTDFTDDDDVAEDGFEEDAEGDLPIYRSGRVRIIGAEPAGHGAHEVTGPVVEEHPEMPHWNDAPTGQVPAILDRASGDEPLMAPPSWREEETDWAAHEEAFEPSMLSDDLPAVGSLVNDNNDLIDTERQPWHFEPSDLLADDETLVIAPLESEPLVAAVPPGVSTAASAAAASRLTPPAPPQPRVRAPRASRLAVGSRNAGSHGTDGNGAGTGTGGRNMQVAVGSGLLLGLLALLCFKLGNLASVVIVTVVVLLAAGEGFAAFRRAQYFPAAPLGLVAVLSLMVATYNKGQAALPLVLVLVVVATFVWFLAGVEPDADPVAGISSTVFVFAWIGGFGSFAALLASPNVFPNRHGIAFLLAAILTTVAADVAGLLVGSSMGRHPMAPNISPNKSWEGFIGGAVASVLMAVVVVHFIHPWTLGKSLVLGLVVAVVAPLGDLSQSLIKRHLGIKDMGRLLPGHGGVLDRVDGLLFVMPATYFVAKALHLG